MIKKIKNPAITASRFLIIPKPLPDEILSSWLARTAYAHRTHPKTFMNLHLQNGHFKWRLNFDASIPDEDIITISSKSGLPRDTIFQMTLRSYDGYLQESIIPDGANTFISPQQKFCPLCLREDQFPYFRRSWKILLQPICLTHHCYLQDRCPSCQSEIKLANMYANNLPFMFCHKCGFDLRKARKQPIPQRLDIAAQRILEISSILKQGYVILNKNPVYSFLFFEVFAKLAKIIVTCKNPSSLNYGSDIKNAIRKAAFSTKQPLIRQLSSRQLLLILCSIIELFIHYPNKFDLFVKTNQLGHWPLSREMKRIPFWYAKLLDQVAPKDCFTSGLLTLEELSNAKKWLEANGFTVDKASLQRIFRCNFYNNLIGKLL